MLIVVLVLFKIPHQRSNVVHFQVAEKLMSARRASVKNGFKPKTYQAASEQLIRMSQREGQSDLSSNCDQPIIAQ